MEGLPKQEIPKQEIPKQETTKTPEVTFTKKSVECARSILELEKALPLLKTRLFSNFEELQ